MTSLLTLLLVTHVTAEWVEISQQHYRKPIRAHSLFTTPDKVIEIEDTTKPWTYNNRSVAEYNWNKNPARPPNQKHIGNVKHMQHTGSTVKTTERVQPEDDDDLHLHVDFRDYGPRPNYGPTRATIDLYEHDEQKGTIKRVPNVANIKRVQLSNSPVKSPAVHNKGDREQFSNNRHEASPHNDGDGEAKQFEHNKNTKSLNRRIYINKVKNVHGTERTATLLPDNDQEQVTTLNTERSNQDARDFYSTKPTFITETKDFTNYETQQKRFYTITNAKSSEVTDKIHVYTTEIMNTEDITKITKLTTANANRNNVPNNINDLKIKSHENIVHVSDNNERQGANDHNTKTKSHNAPSMQDHQFRKENESQINKEIKDKTDEAPPNNKTRKNKVNTMENVTKFMRVVADTISKNSRKSFGGKMQYLRELKDSILANIGK